MMEPMVESFCACVMSEVLSHRGTHGADLVKQFGERIAAHVERYAAKTGISDGTMVAIRNIADAAVAKAVREGRVQAYAEC
jgi:hypothetical protein